MRRESPRIRVPSRSTQSGGSAEVVRALDPKLRGREGPLQRRASRGTHNPKGVARPGTGYFVASACDASPAYIWLVSCTIEKATMNRAMLVTIRPMTAERLSEGSSSDMGAGGEGVGAGSVDLGRRQGVILANER